MWIIIRCSVIYIYIIFSEITCPDPSIQIKDSVGLLVVTSTLSIGGEAHYRCERGYSLRGNQTRTCLPRGKWFGAPPVCIRKLLLTQSSIFFKDNFIFLLNFFFQILTSINYMII